MNAVHFWELVCSVGIWCHQSTCVALTILVLTGKVQSGMCFCFFFGSPRHTCLSSDCENEGHAPGSVGWQIHSDSKVVKASLTLRRACGRCGAIKGTAIFRVAPSFFSQTVERGKVWTLIKRHEETLMPPPSSARNKRPTRS